MGEFRFRLPDDWNPSVSQSRSIHVIGLDGIPAPCRVSVNDGILSVVRNQDDSGKVFITWPFEDFGEITVGTGTLPESDEPYRLVVELARGTLNRLRNQISIWREGGLKVDVSVDQQISSATKLLSEAIMDAGAEGSERDARESLRIAMAGNFNLGHQFGAEISKFRISQQDFPRFWIANAVEKNLTGPENYSTPQFHLVQVRPEQAEAAAAIDDKRMIVGPFLDASPGGMEPEIVELDDFLARKDFILNRCRKVIRQLNPAASLLHVVSGLNGMGHRRLSYPQQTQITSEMLNLIDESQVEVPMMVSFDYPWGERLASAVGGAHPIQIADSLMRQGSNVSFIGLDINLDFWPCGSVVRDPLQWIDMIDIWSQLGLPLIILLRMPSGKPPEKSLLDESENPTNEIRSAMTDQQRLFFLEKVIPMLIARPTVHGLVWRQWGDEDDPRFPGSGLAQANGEFKPVIESIGKATKVLTAS